MSAFLRDGWTEPYQIFRGQANYCVLDMTNIAQLLNADSCVSAMTCVDLFY